MSDFAKTRDMSRFFKKVIQIDKNSKEIIKIWNSGSDASEYLTGDRKQTTRITAACKGRSKSAMGYYWKYLETE